MTGPQVVGHSGIVEARVPMSIFQDTLVVVRPDGQLAMFGLDTRELIRTVPLPQHLLRCLDRDEYVVSCCTHF